MQEASDEADVCVRRIIAALLCPGEQLHSQAAAVQGGDTAMLEDGRDLEGGAAAAEPSPGFAEAPDMGTAAARVAVARDVSTAWALRAAEGPAGNAGDSSGECLPTLPLSQFSKVCPYNHT